MLRGIIFTGVYYILSTITALIALPFVFFPGRGAVSWIIRTYTRSLNFSLRFIAGIKKEVRGKHHLPKGTYILAAKHSSWGDGFMIYPEVKRLSFVTGDHLLSFPLVGRILEKLGAIVIDYCGGKKADSLKEGLERAKGDDRSILIYPEGHLAPVGHYFNYKSGVWHMQKALNVPIIPVATNLNCFWQQEEIQKTPGTAVLEFLAPIPPGLSKDETMKRLKDAVETRSAELIAEATGLPLEPSILLPDPAKGSVAKPLDTAALTAK